MIAVAWRQFRLQAAVASGLLALVAVVVLVSGANLSHLYEINVVPCAKHHDCPTARATFLRSDHFLQASLPALLLVAPVLIGVFWGAPLVAREFETGTFRLAWTQSISRRRWLVTRVALVGLTSMAVAGLLSLMVSWWFSPIDRLTLDRMSPATFGVRGVAPIGYAAFAFALGVALGVLVRRTLPAMALTIVGFLGARVGVTYRVRPYLASSRKIVTPLLMGSDGATPSLRTGPAGSWVLSSQTLNRNGHVIGQHGGIGPNGDLGLQVSHDRRVSIPGVGGCPGARIANPRSSRDFASVFNACARHHGLREVVTFQPASRYWPFQWEETALFLFLALALAGFSVWWLVLRQRRHGRQVVRGSGPRGIVAAMGRTPDGERSGEWWVEIDRRAAPEQSRSASISPLRVGDAAREE